jgi:hypothetical protein
MPRPSLHADDNGSPGIHQAPLDAGANVNAPAKDSTETGTIVTMQWLPLLFRSRA